MKNKQNITVLKHRDAQFGRPYAVTDTSLSAGHNETGFHTVENLKQNLHSLNYQLSIVNY
jgi:hypothetical protein